MRDGDTVTGNMRDRDTATDGTEDKDTATGGTGDRDTAMSSSGDGDTATSGPGDRDTAPGGTRDSDTTTCGISREAVVGSRDDGYTGTMTISSVWERKVSKSDSELGIESDAPSNRGTATEIS
jgi:hypothetical protein